MSREIIQSQRSNFDFAFSLLERFIDICPDAIWETRFGGWPVWQQAYHALTSIEFFILAPDRQPSAALAPGEVGSLAAVGGAPVARERMKAFAADMKNAADAYLDGLADSSLACKAEGASLRMGRDVTHAMVIILLAGHILYHLGSCDAALREQGRAGVF